jgi:hypothetical protein
MQPEYFFDQFVEAVKPGIEAFTPCAPTTWWQPYSALMGITRNTIFKWRSWKRLPEYAYQNARNILALHQIATLGGDAASLEQARTIARERLTEALAGVERIVPPRARRYRYISKPYPKTPRAFTPEETARALNLHGQGCRPSDIGKVLDRDPCVIRRLLKKHGVATPRLRWDGPQAIRLLETGVSLETVAKIVGQRPKTVQQYAARHPGAKS